MPLAHRLEQLARHSRDLRANAISRKQDDAVLGHVDAGRQIDR
ncbi:hypothetical protein SynBOUM118_00847 [Synechococcus sp. BOUM118]|jgi:hypothetical protein|nr:hypothetical protein SynBOUM118_00847 [Synechococcus sp. BOUM118]